VTGVLDLLERSAGTEAWMLFVPESKDRVPFADVWQDAATAADWFSARTAEGDTVAMVLTGTRASVTAMLGAWRAGLRIASLPDPSRMATNDYVALLRHVQADVVPSLVVVPPSAMTHLPPVGVPLAPHEASTAGGPPGRRDYAGGFVQYTSGSTQRPAGVRLTADAIAAGISAIIDRFRGVVHDPVICSWLPLSHDMGLFGGCLASLVAAPEAPNATGTCLIDTALFARQPRVWLRTCTEVEASITVSSVLGLELACRLSGRPGEIDLSRLETCIVGAEQVRMEVLDRFVERYRPLGLAPHAIRPSYGLAENTLAVTIPEFGAPLVARTIEALEISTVVGDGTRVVSCGSPVPGTEVRIANADAAGVGEIAIRGDALFQGYTGGREPRCDGDWFLTGDMGTMVDGCLYPVGRSDDMIVARGLNIMPTEVEALAADVLGRVCKAAAAVPDGDGAFEIVVELSTATASFPDLAAALRSACARRFSVAPTRVVAVPRGMLPRTASGKIRRVSTRWMLDRAEFEVLAQHG
jgi:acyl-CoA synthetase (AMP-forming)/AMP-acid ligase II